MNPSHGAPGAPFSKQSQSSGRSSISRGPVPDERQGDGAAGGDAVRSLGERDSEQKQQETAGANRPSHPLLSTLHRASLGGLPGSTIDEPQSTLTNSPTARLPPDIASEQRMRGRRANVRDPGVSGLTADLASALARQAELRRTSARASVTDQAYSSPLLMQLLEPSRPRLSLESPLASFSLDQLRARLIQLRQEVGAQPVRLPGVDVSPWEAAILLGRAGLQQEGQDRKQPFLDARKDPPLRTQTASRSARGFASSAGLHGARTLDSTFATAPHRLTVAKRPLSTDVLSPDGAPTRKRAAPSSLRGQENVLLRELVKQSRTGIMSGLKYMFPLPPLDSSKSDRSEAFVGVGESSSYHELWKKLEPAKHREELFRRIVAKGAVNIGSNTRSAILKTERWMETIEKSIEDQTG